MATPMAKLLGRMITRVRLMTRKEMREKGWGDHGHQPVVIVLEDGSILYPARDPEGNGPGVIVHVRGDVTTTF